MTSASGFQQKPKHDRSKYLPLSGQVQNSQNAKVYIFGGADITEEEINTDADQIELSELRTRGRGKRKKKRKNTETEQVVLVEKEIGEGDTLQTIALRYGCPVSELKRVNNLITDQDFYARRNLKVPMRQHGLLLEDEESNQKEGGAQNINHLGPNLPNGHRLSDGSDNGFSDSDDSQTEFIRTISIPGSLDGENKAAQEFFDRMDKDLHVILEKTNTQKETLDEVTSHLRETRFRPLASPSHKAKPNNGATCGVTWRNLVITLILILVVVPIIGIILALSKKLKII